MATAALNPCEFSPSVGSRAALDPLYYLDHLGYEAWPEVKPLLRRALEMRLGHFREAVRVDSHLAQARARPVFGGGALDGDALF